MFITCPICRKMSNIPDDLSDEEFEGWEFSSIGYSGDEFTVDFSYKCEGCQKPLCVTVKMQPKQIDVYEEKFKPIRNVGE